MRYYIIIIMTYDKNSEICSQNNNEKVKIMILSTLWDTIYKITTVIQNSDIKMYILLVKMIKNIIKIKSHNYDVLIHKYVMSNK